MSELPKALVFDDETHRHQTLQADLEGDFEVHHAYNMEAALAAMKKTKFDYVTLDHDMGQDPDGTHCKTGRDLTKAMVADLPEAQRPLVTRIHSWNPRGAIDMLKDLQGAGFPNVHYRPFQV